MPQRQSQGNAMPQQQSQGNTLGGDNIDPQQFGNLFGDLFKAG